jgi:hypothetical protein
MAEDANISHHGNQSSLILPHCFYEQLEADDIFWVPKVESRSSHTVLTEV